MKETITVTKRDVTRAIMQAIDTVLKETEPDKTDFGYFMLCNMLQIALGHEVIQILFKEDETVTD